MAQLSGSGNGIEALSYLEPQPTAEFAALVGAVLRAVGPRPEQSETPFELTDEIWRVCAEPARRHRILATIGVAVETGRILAEPALARELTTFAYTKAASRLHIEQSCNTAVDLLAAQGIEARVLKGLATGALDHSSPAVRQTSDVDLLVRPSDFDAAVACFRGENWIEIKHDEPSELLVETTFRTPRQTEIDLHHRLFRFGPRQSETLFAHPQPIPGLRAPALPLEGRMLHAAAHLLISPPNHRQISSLLDVAVIGADPMLDRDRLHALAAEFGMADLVAFTEWIAAALRGSESSPPGHDRTLINLAHLRTNRRIDLETLAVLADLDGWNRRLRYLRYQLRRSRRGSVTASNDLGRHQTS